MKNQIFETKFAPILNRLSGNDLLNARANSCNLFAEFINDYTTDGFEVELTEFFEAVTLSNDEKHEFRENPDSILTGAYNDFLSSVACAFFKNSINDADDFIKKAKFTLSGYSETFHFFVYPWSNCCFDAFVIRDEESEAVEILREKFEKDDDQNGFDNLVFLGSIEFKVKQ